jgi:hypothetical protein
MTLLARFGLLIAAAATSLIAFASDPYVEVEKRLTPAQMHETGLDTLSRDQLARLNELLRGESERATSASAHADDGHPAAVASARVDDEPGGAAYTGPDRPILSRVVGKVTGWAPDTVFVLENGQRWKVLKGTATLRTPLDAPEVKVVPGLAGRWFLQVVEDMPKARVYRID